MNMLIVMNPRYVRARQLAERYWELQPKRCLRRKLTRAVKVAHSKQLEILMEIGTLGHGDALQFVLLYRGISAP